MVTDFETTSPAEVHEYTYFDSSVIVTSSEPESSVEEIPGPLIEQSDTSPAGLHEIVTSESGSTVLGAVSVNSAGRTVTVACDVPFPPGA